MARPYILAAMNGARRSRADHPALPVTTDQILAEAAACQMAGADGVHLHIRDAAGVHSLDPGLYRETVAALSAAVPELDIQITTEAAGIYDVAAQLACLRGVQPAWASISVREIARAPELAAGVYGLCAEQGTRVQHILYDAADAALLGEWQQAGTVAPEQNDRLLVLGRYSAGQVSAPEDLDAFPAAAMVAGSWMICAFGAGEHACLAEAARRGGDLRVGFENGLTAADGTPWKDNAASVAALVNRLEGDPA